jgi:hypothetical protein
MKKNKEGRPSKHTFKIVVDGDELVFNRPTVLGEDILVKAGKTPATCYTLYQKLKGCDFERINLQEEVDLTNPGLERFTVKSPEVFYYFLDEESETTDSEYMTPNKILEAGGITPVTDYYLIEVDAKGQEESHKDNPDKPIKMKCPGSKFVSVFRGETPVS